MPLSPPLQGRVIPDGTELVAKTLKAEREPRPEKATRLHPRPSPAPPGSVHAVKSVLSAADIVGGSPLSTQSARVAGPASPSASPVRPVRKERPKTAGSVRRTSLTAALPRPVFTVIDTADHMASAAAAAGLLPADIEPPTPNTLRKGLSAMPKLARDSWPGPRGSAAGKRVVEAHGSWGAASARLRKRPQTAPGKREPLQTSVLMQNLMKADKSHAPDLMPDPASTEARPDSCTADPSAQGAALAGQLAQVLAGMPDAVAGACAVLDCAADLPTLRDALEPGWKTLLRAVRDALAPAVLADPSAPVPPLSPQGRKGGNGEWWSKQPPQKSTSAATVEWVRKRAESLRTCTSWRSVCEFSSRRDEVLGMAATRKLKRCGGGSSGASALAQTPDAAQSATNHWRRVLGGIVLRLWNAHTKESLQRRSVVVVRFSERRRRQMLLVTLHLWRAYSANLRKQKSDAKLVHVSKLCAGLREYYEELKDRYEKLEHANRSLRAERDDLLSQVSVLRKSLADRRENPFFFDLAHPFVDRDSTVIQKGFVAFARPDMSQQCLGVRDGGGGELESEPAFYDVWVTKGDAQVRLPWEPDRVMLQWAANVLDKFVRPLQPHPPSVEALVPISLRKLRDARHKPPPLPPGSKPSPVSFSGQPGRKVELLAGLGRDQLTSDHWIALFAAVQPRGLAVVAQDLRIVINAGAGPTREERNLLVWRTAGALGLNGDIDPDGLRRGEPRHVLLLLTKLFCYAVASGHLPPEELAARDACAATPLWGPPPVDPPPAPLRSLLVPDNGGGLGSSGGFSSVADLGESMCSQGPTSGMGAVALWVGSELQAGQTGQTLQYVGCPKEPLLEPLSGATKCFAATMVAVGKMQAARRGSSGSPKDASPKKPSSVRMGGKSKERKNSPQLAAVSSGPDPMLLWWGTASSGWQGVESMYRSGGFADADLESTRKELVKLSALAAHVTKHRSGEPGLRPPAPPSGDERSERLWREKTAAYLLRCHSALSGGAPPPLPAAALSVGSGDARMIYTCALWSAVWQRQRAESGDADDSALEVDADRKRGRDKRRRRGTRARSDRRGQRDRTLSPMRHDVRVTSAGQEASLLLLRSLRPVVLLAAGFLAKGRSAHAAIAAAQQQIQQQAQERTAEQLEESDQSAEMRPLQVPEEDACGPDMESTRAMILTIGGNIVDLWRAYQEDGCVQLSGALRMLSDSGLLSEASEQAHTLIATRRAQALVDAPEPLRAALPSIGAAEAREMFQQAWVLRPEAQQGMETGLLSTTPVPVEADAGLGLGDTVVFLLMVASRVTSQLRGLSTADRFKHLMLRAVLPAAHHADSAGYVSRLYTEKSQAVLRMFITTLGAIFTAFSSCPTASRLLDEREMSERQYLLLLTAADIVPSLVSNRLARGVFTSTVLAADDGRRCVAPPEQSVMDFSKMSVLGSDSGGGSPTREEPDGSMLRVSSPTRRSSRITGGRSSLLRSRGSIMPGRRTEAAAAAAAAHQRQRSDAEFATSQKDAASGRGLLTVGYTQFVETLFILSQGVITGGLLLPEVKFETFLTHHFLPSAPTAPPPELSCPPPPPPEPPVRSPQLRTGRPPT